MKFKIFLACALICSILFTPSLYARGSHYRSPKMPKYGSTYGKTHNVRPFFKKDGTFIQSHRAANPRSGVHCHNNACY
ncbi:hypothetical protein SFB54_15595 [Legionella pneumophila subsp. fraseri]|nr:hypothetical protein [Legionella pneumophila]MDW8880644.1 hypothetical protein [Legionella pneumophila subsp. fraseri]MDW8962260.1 hypothetical protein [Legionella pneumophila subsp. fraseri]MDW9034746.1 hypothetical protein [Legionella pneumophila subsp. fraseri]MDW9037578.1 hypothetical protein [Legionella pneumophila subsp. fraseri]MDW9040867.1 hypothetical protein [Legionella pneumophila subsp. fraseri]